MSGRPAEWHAAELLPGRHALYRRPMLSDEMLARLDWFSAPLPAARGAASAASAAAAEMRAAKGRHPAQLRVSRTAVRPQLRV